MADQTSPNAHAITNKTPTHATRTLATSIDTLAEGLDALRRAHATLTWPENECEVADWPAIVGQVNALGQASARLATTAKETLLPVLKMLKALAQQNEAEVRQLNQALALTPTDRPRPCPPNTPSCQEARPPCLPPLRR